ncbi:hypothetical protein AYI69_g8472, partial [Smittium culicis]
MSKKNIEHANSKIAKTEPKTTEPINITNPENISYGHTTPQLLPGMAGAPVFDGEDLTEFLSYYEIITIKSSDAEKTMLFPFYCIQKIRSVITKYIPYIERDWVKLQLVLKDYYMREDSRDKIQEDINNLVKKGTKLRDIKTYLHQFEFILQKYNRISSMIDREKRETLLKSINPADLIKIQNQLYDNKGDFLNYDDISTKLKTLATMEKNLQNIIGSYSTETQPLNPDKAKDVELVKMMGKLCIKIDTAIDKNIKDVRVNDKFKRPIRCIYCDGAHIRSECDYFKVDKESGLIKVGSDGFIGDIKGNKIPTNWGKGGMRTLINNTQSNSRQIKIEPPDNYDFAVEWETINEDSISELDFSTLVNSFASKRSLDNMNEGDYIKKKGKFQSEKNTTNLENLPLFDRIKELQYKNLSENKSNKDEFEPPYKMV